MPLETVHMQLNLGPQHPATHGVFKIILSLDGERIVRAEPVLGYLHRGIEKLVEYRTYQQILPMFDRLDYVAALLNELAYVKAIEEMLEIEIPPRAEYLRVILCELQRIASHLMWLAAYGMDLGAITPFFYLLREREIILDIFEIVSGGRLTPAFFRIGGIREDIPSNFIGKVRKFVDLFPVKIEEYDQLLTGNEIFLARTKGVGILSAEDAINFGVSGPVLRASGVNFDIRRIEPYSVYDHFDFKIPTDEGRDCFGRYLVRMEEMRQSTRIIKQALDQLPDGEVKTKVPKNIKIEEDHYSRIEASKGELGVYIKGDGSNKPYRLKIRAPAFVNLMALPKMLENALVADVVAILGSIDICMGEVDR